MPSVNNMRISTGTGETTFGIPVPFPTPVAPSHVVPVPVVPASHSGPGVRGATTAPETASETPAVPAQHRPMMAEMHAPSEQPEAAHIYSFSIQLVAGEATQFNDIPHGWSITEPTTGVIQVETKLDRAPMFISGFAASGDPLVWKQCGFSSETLYASYGQDLSRFSLTGVSSDMRINVFI